MSFLAAHDPRPLAGNFPAGFEPVALHLGQGGQALEIAVFKSGSAPSQTALKTALRERRGRRASPVLVVVLYGERRAAVCGVDEDHPSVHADLDRSQVERLCLKALGAPDRHIATRALRDALPQFATALPGLTNHGLFAMHELEAGVPRRGDWSNASRDASNLLALRGRELMQGLGFTIRELSGADPGSVLVASGTKVAVAVFLERPDEIDPPLARFNDRAPISWALAKADEENLDYVVISAGSSLRVYPTKPGVGAGRRGRTETYVSLDLDLLRPSHAAYLRLICSAEALSPGGTFEDILARSQDFAAELGARLRDRVYRDVVPQLARALVKAQRLRSPSAERLRETYELVLRVLFRLLFVAYAEDNDRLPLHSNANYRKHSLKEMAKRLQQEMADGVEPSREDFYWTEVHQLWKAVDKGNRGWGVPEYNGGLFSSAQDNPLGSKLGALSLPDSDFVPALRKLLLDETAEGQAGPIDFRPLGVREFGTIYEGLLESELSVAEVDLAVERGKDQRYIPAKRGAAVVVEAGEVYLHNASGARKSSGAYYTKSFAVEYLLERALDPAIDDHFGRLDALEDRDAADRLFEFRVADIAMGSGHFLVAALDHIERRFQNYLVKRSLPGVADELERLRQAAREQLGDDFDPDALEDVRLLRRQIARRCVYGVDVNPLAVELARLSIWIHSFVPGLPLSFLDGNLVVGNSLVGIGTLDEAAALLGEGKQDLFVESGLKRLERAREPMQRLARLADASAAEIKEAKRLHAQLKREIRSEDALLSVLTASRTDDEIRAAVQVGNVATRLEKVGDPFSDSLVRRAERSLAGLDAFHFPVAFPQVFLSDRAGFDVIVGNPPWEEVMCDVNEFWGRHIPGFRGLPQREQETQLPRFRRERPDLEAEFERERARVERLRAYVVTDAFPGLETGHPDLYKVFCWRFWNLVSPKGGRIGVVLPRSALSAKGTAEFRRLLFRESSSTEFTTMVNTKGWVFPEVHQQYTIGLAVILRGEAERKQLTLRGPYADHQSFAHGIVREGAVFDPEQVVEWNDTASLPLLPTAESAGVFLKLRRAPRLDADIAGSWRARPVQGDLNATWGKPLMDLRAKTCPEGYWAVLGGEGFDLWTPDTGTYYAYASPKKVLPALFERAVNAAKMSSSAFSELPRGAIGSETALPCRSPRIAFRDITNRTNTRTVVTALVPGDVILTNKAPFLLWARGDAMDEAFLLGVLSSRLLDWYARRFVEVSLNFFILNPFPVPRPARSQPLWERVVRLSGRLASPDRRFAVWAKKVGVPYGKLAEDEKQDMITELDAAVAHLYGLEASDLRHIFETFHEGWEYGPQLEATLRHFEALRRLV